MLCSCNCNIVTVVKTGLLIFRGKKEKFRGICRGKFAEKSSNFAGFSREKSQISKDFRGQIYGGKLCQETISKKQPISLDFFGKFC